MLSQLHDALTKSFKYAEVEGTSGQWYLLTDKGHEAKAAGGHFSYINRITDKIQVDQNRQQLNDEKLKYDVKNAKRIFKTYWWTFVISILAFLLAAGKIIYDVITKAK